MVWLARVERTGASLTAATVRRKLLEVVAVPSLTLRVMTAVPFCWAAGVTVTVRLAPLPPNAILAAGTSAGLEELPVTVRLPAAVSASPTVKAKVPVDVFSLIVWLMTEETIGALFPDTTTISGHGRLSRPELL